MLLHTTWAMVPRALLVLLWAVSPGSCFQLEALLSQHGVTGSVIFSPDEESTHVRVNLNASESYAGEYSWGIYEFPINYESPDYCNSRMLGRKPMINLVNLFGDLILPGESKEFTTESIPMSGPQSIWGRSLVLEGPSRSRICGTIVPSKEFKTWEARFTSPIAGSVWFTSLSGGEEEHIETRILSNLYHVQNGKSSGHPWQIFITDILTSVRKRNTCDFLQILYDPENRDGLGCSKDSPQKCKEGDLTSKFGAVRVGQRESIFTKSSYTDSSLMLPESEGPRSVYLVIYDEEHEGSFLSCARMRLIRPKEAEAAFSHKGILGSIKFRQNSPFQPVHSSVDLKGLNFTVNGYHVHKFPVPLKTEEKDEPCTRTGGHFNPFGVDPSIKIDANSLDKFEVGDLSGKYGGLKDKDSYSVQFIDPNLSLFGKLSIVGRSIVIHENPTPNRFVCTNIDLKDRSLLTSVATFTYPIAGRIIFRQEADDAFADTTIFVESLLYSDGSQNDTSGHKWHVHVSEPGKDYYNWTGRCISAGGHYNPYRISLDDSIYSSCVNEGNPLRCELGDLVNKHETLKIAGRKRDVSSMVSFFTDTNLPLSGATTINGRSIVIHDDHALKHRGNRMACTSIRRLYRYKAVAKDWFGNGVPPPITGRLEFIQDTEQSPTHALVDLHGLDQLANGYHVHTIPVQNQLELPCTADAVGGHFNPWNVIATSDNGTRDQYEIGDLSSKYGFLEGLTDIRSIHNDSSLPLFGHNSIVGRSIVVHKLFKGQRWACATIGWGFDPDEARQIQAIASFHHPNGFAWGYIRFSQVMYNDGSTSSTTMEVRLKYPGKTNRAQTHGHDWSIYVSPVHHDAAVKFSSARCTAAGYRWNPTHIQLADPNNHGLYSEECGTDYPLRCQVGDLSGKNGKISIGGKAYVVNDVHLTLQSDDWFTTAIGKSIVIHGPDGRPERMACANIEKDTDIIKYVAIRTKARFNLAVFMEEVQALMGIPEWFLFTDSRKTKSLNGGNCLQVKLHFTGPHAAKLEQDFDRLIRTGTLASPSIQIPGYFPDSTRVKKLGYRECDSSSNRPSRTRPGYFGSASSLNVSLAIIFLAISLVLRL